MKSVKDSIAIVVEVVAGVLAGLLLLGLIPDDSLSVDTLGAVVGAVLLGGLSYLASRYRKHLHV